MMTKEEIPPDQWPEYFDAFGRLHHGKEAQITLIEPDAAAHSFAKDGSLLGLIDERHGKTDEAIAVMLGGAREGTSSHTIRKPARVSTAEWNDAYSAKLEIESSDGRRLIIQVGPVRETLPPGMITDGVLLEQPP
jgi:hypothetical protein